MLLHLKKKKNEDRGMTTSSSVGSTKCSLSWQYYSSVKYFHSFTCSDGILRSLSECVFSDRFGQEPTKAVITAMALLLECLKHPLYYLSSDNYVLLNGTV